MPDNSTANAASGGDTFAFDEIGGIKFGRSKLIIGADGTNDGDVCATNPLPVKVAAGATAFSKAEDAASADADVGVACLAVRKATPANTSGTDGDYEFLQISAGRLWASAVIDTALPAGTNAIGKLASNSGVIIGAVEIAAAQTLAAVTTVGTVSAVTTVATVTNVATIGTSVTPGTGAAHLGKAEDDAHNSGDTGVMSLAVRKNTAASTSGSDGDYQPLITNTTGHLWVDASGQTLTVGAHNVTNAGTFAVQATIAAGAAAIAKAEDVASADADVGVPAMAIRKATPANTSGTDGDYEMLQMSAGRLWVDASGQTLTVSAHAVTNAGTFATQDSEKIADDAAFTVATSKVQPAGYMADETATDSVDEGDVGIARMTLDRKQVVSLYAHTAGGWTPGRFISAAGSNQDATVIKGSAGQLGYVFASNINAAARYLKLYNLASGATSSSTPVHTFLIPGNAAGSGFVFNIPAGILFDTGISFRLTTGVADNDANAISANETVISYGYK